MIIATLLFALAPAIQDRAPVVPVVPIVRGVAINRATGEPVQGFQLRVAQFDGEKVEVLCESDNLGRFEARGAFRIGSVHIASVENMEYAGRSPRESARALAWDGEGEVTVAVNEGLRFDVDLPGGELPEMGEGKLRIAWGELSVQTLLRGYRTTSPAVMNVRRPLEPGGSHWIRFDSTFGAHRISLDKVKQVAPAADVLTAYSTDGLWYGTFEVPEAGKAIRVDLEPRAVLRCDVQECDPPPAFVIPHGASREDLLELLEARTQPVSSVEVRMEAEGQQRAVLKRKVTIGRALQFKWMEPGLYRMSTESAYFPPYERAALLAPGVTDLPDLVLGKRKPVAGIRIVIRDFDGDITNDVVAGEPDPWNNYENYSLWPSVGLRSKELGLWRSAPSRAFGCATGIDDWCEFVGSSGDYFAEANFEQLPDGEFIATVHVEGRHVEPAQLTLRPGDVGEFTLRPLDTSSGYWIRASEEGKPWVSEGGAYSFEKLVARQMEMDGLSYEERSRESGGPLLFLHKKRPEQGLGVWAVRAEGYQTTYLDEQSFLLEGGRFVAPVEMVPGWACRFQLEDETGASLADVALTWEGHTYVSDKEGVVLLTSDELYPRGTIDSGGFEVVSGLSSKGHVFMSADDATLVLRRLP